MPIDFFDKCISPCTICAQEQQGCCVKEQIVLTKGDIARIDAVEPGLWRIKGSLLRSTTVLDPIWDHFVSGECDLIRTSADGYCWFLSDKVCVLNMNVRPLVCRLYPYDYFTKDTLPDPTPETACCPKRFFAASEGIAEFVGVRRELALCWHTQLYKEILQSVSIIIYKK